MTLLLLRLTKPSEQIRMSFGPEEVRSVQLEAYWAEGLLSTQPLFFQIRNQPARTVHGNGIGTSYFPLMFETFPNTSNFLRRPLEICGPDNVWRDCSLLQIEVVNYLGNPATFSNLMLQFRINDPSHSVKMTLTRLEKSLMQT